jgi:hypothetical protein
MQKVLSTTNIHHGKVTIFKELDLTGKYNNVPNKLFLNLVKFHKDIQREYTS